ncbi:MAG: aspartate kinase [Syntrophorhabdaceae bacterium]|nr:aspartate kinase [Syntrophorhabdaceae bacterium]
MIVLKFGGSSLGTTDRIRRCVAIVKEQIGRRPVVVVSAHGKTTDNLIGSAKNALDGKVEIEAIREYHQGLAEDLEIDWAVASPLFQALEGLLRGISLIRELTPRTLDHVMSFGERLSSNIVAAALVREGVPAIPVNSYDAGLLTDSRYGNATPLKGIEAAIANRMGAIAEVPVVTGFIGRDEKGSVTTLGRSGSDFTASIIGAAVDAEEIQIWKDVDGVMTADPFVYGGALNIPEMSFSEASELAYYGAEILHPSTLVPAMAKKIPVRVANTRKPDEAGTMILADSGPVDRMAKSIVYKENLCLINIVSPKFDSTTRLLSSALEVLARQDIGIHIAATSESSVSFVTDRSYPEEMLVRTYGDLQEIGTVSIDRGKALICVVGEELKGNPKVLGDIFTSVGKAEIKARMVSQSASEINIAFLVDDSEIAVTVTNLHRILIGV